MSVAANREFLSFLESEPTATIEISSTSFDDDSSNAGDFPSENCVDGNVETKCESQSLGTTLTIETATKENIMGVEITINEENKDSLLGAIVKIDNQTCGTINEIPSDASLSFIFTCDNAPIFGETLTITAQDNKTLSLNEIEIIGQGKLQPPFLMLLYSPETFLTILKNLMNLFENFSFFLS